jgi:hypothetical protein
LSKHYIVKKFGEKYGPADVAESKRRNILKAGILQRRSVIFLILIDLRYSTALSKGSGSESEKALGSEVKIRNAARKVLTSFWFPRKLACSADIRSLWV